MYPEDNDDTVDGIAFAAVFIFAPIGFLFVIGAVIYTALSMVGLA